MYILLHDFATQIRLSLNHVIKEPYRILSYLGTPDAGYHKKCSMDILAVTTNYNADDFLVLPTYGSILRYNVPVI